MDPSRIPDQWRIGLRISHRAHLEAAKYYDGLHRNIGIPAVVLSAVFGTTVFTNLQNSGSEWIKYLLAVLSVVMIVLSSLQTFFRFSERAERHRTSAVQIGAARRELEQLLFCSGASPVDCAALAKLRQEWDAADKQAPTIPSSIYNRVQTDVWNWEKEGADDPNH
jgi:hypothetical protein